ncbi:MAG TPA: type IV-A pilus assembly ATPase PilB [Usitatibacteraceae bacterium]|nr:type IV-A pilus assembly ATPase PilB [Usitatibacteraceae bacterium]
MSAAPGTYSALGRALVQQGRLVQADATAIQLEASKAGVTFVQQLVSSKKLSARDISQFAAHAFGYPLLDLSAVDTDQLPLNLIDSKIVTNHRVIALGKRGNRLFVGMSDPTNEQVIQEVKFATGMTMEPVVVEDDKLTIAVKKLGDATIRAFEVGTEEVDLSGVEVTESDAQPEVVTEDIDDAPVVRYVQKILLDAINGGASDIHFEPYEKFYRIRYRQDGVLYDVAQPPLAIKEKIASRIKVVSRMDISEKRVPQDGRMKIVLSKTRAIDFRVSTLPTLFGEKICIRILDSSNTMLGIDALGYEPDQREALMAAIQRPYGMVLVTGPTGSGKTVSLYTCLNILNKPGINISTAEDPAEIHLPGINQVNMNDKAGLTFAVALKAFLRQDPDVIMVGEIRDLETGEIAIKAAQTGHMVLSTVHTNDAPATLSRLMNMGIAPFNIASSVILITAQRLARKLCTCKRPVSIPEEALLRAGFREEDLNGTWQTYEPVGCEVCKNTGYKGRVGIYQVMPVSEEIERIIMKNGTSIDVGDQAQRDGVRDLRQSGLLKVRRGLTSLEEIEAVTNE